MAHERPDAMAADTGEIRDAARDIAVWRRVERNRLRAERQQLNPSQRQAVGEALVGHLGGLLRERGENLRGRIFAGFWPIRSEPDLRPLMTRLHEAGVTIVLPLVETRATPLVFRRWTPQTRMVPGHWNIPVPAAGADALTPDIVVAPLVGWDDQGYRLGYGGGYFDRTLAALSPRPFTIGVGYQSSRLATIHPQAHDIPLAIIVTEAGVQASREVS